jgi:SHS2 domain-containing protein
LFEVAAEAVAHIAGAWEPGEGATTSIEVEAHDRAALLVDWLSETLYLYDSRGCALAGVEVACVSAGACAGSVILGPLHEGDPGVQVKAITYHQLEVAQLEDGWSATVYLDI